MSDLHRTIETVWRNESPRLIARIARIVRDVGIAEELAQDALVTAMEQWPTEGLPENPGAWLMATAKHRAIDQVRRNKRLAEKQQEMGREREARELSDESAQLDAKMDDDIGDDLLRLVFTACHPVLSTEARVALTLRLLGGLTTDEIARAYLVPEPTIAQRIVRAKKTLAEKNVGFEAPRAAELPERLASVLEVIYLIFNEGYTATAGDDWMRPALCDDAIRLASVLARLMPDEPEVHGILALMEIQCSRAHARTTADGTPILLLDQDRSKWDWAQIERGLAALDRAERLRPARGMYTLQAAIAACHARARRAPETDWARIADLYGDLSAMIPSPVIELNRAVALGMAFGPAAGLEVADQLQKEGALNDYHLLPSVRGDFLAKLGRHAEAKGEFERAAAMTRNARERALLLDRANASGSVAGG
jgi:RNA polymerase sigma factor (sigma-70 family)